jgi:aerobic-type carbon monoxide dehydrogenase small subunit (CoxS/CutS family)
MRDTIRFTLNGKPLTLETDGDRILLWILRTDRYGVGLQR